jgi:ribosomal protein S18 acetylase RimI-like enzyme
MSRTWACWSRTTRAARAWGWALMEAAVEWARESGVRKLELHVFSWNEPAIKLYERFGFEREASSGVK